MNVTNKLAFSRTENTALNSSSWQFGKRKWERRETGILGSGEMGMVLANNGKYSTSESANAKQGTYSCQLNKVASKQKYKQHNKQHDMAHTITTNLNYNSKHTTIIYLKYIRHKTMHNTRASGTTLHSP